MVYKLYGHPFSTCTNRVLIVAKEVGLEIEYHQVDLFKGEHKSEDFLKHQPFGQVPYLVDTEEGVTFYESRAITRYLATKANAGHLVPLPEDPAYIRKLALFEQAVFVGTNTFERFAADLAYECVFKEPSGHGMPDPGKVDYLVNTLGQNLDAYEKILGKQPYLAGDQVTLADLSHTPFAPYLAKMGQMQLLESRPNVNRWWQSMVARQSIKDVLKL